MTNRPIFLLSDFGNDDSYVAAMKAVILSINENAKIVDITHSIESQNIRSGAFELLTIFDYLPNNSITLAIVDPGVGSSRNIIAIEFDSKVILAPDNGIISFITAQRSHSSVNRIKSDIIVSSEPSATFHGRDVFSPIAAKLSLGEELIKFSDQINLDEIEQIRPLKFNKINSNKWIGEITKIDKFGNIISSLVSDCFDFEQSKYLFKIKNTLIDEVSKSYFDASETNITALKSSSGFIEFTLKNGSAWSLIKVPRWSEIEVVKI